MQCRKEIECLKQSLKESGGNYSSIISHYFNIFIEYIKALQIPG